MVPHVAPKIGTVCMYRQYWPRSYGVILGQKNSSRDGLCASALVKWPSFVAPVLALAPRQSNMWRYEQAQATIVHSLSKLKKETQPPKHFSLQNHSMNISVVFGQRSDGHRLPTANNTRPVLMAVLAAQPAEQPAMNPKDWMVVFA